MSPFLPKLQLEHVLHQMHLAKSDGRSLAIKHVAGDYLFPTPPILRG